MAVTGALALGLLVASLVGCAAAPPAPVEHVGRRLTVLPPNNRTGDPLVVAGSSLLDRYVRHAPRVTVADVLASEAELQLKDKGFEISEVRAGTAALPDRAPTSAEAAIDLAAQRGVTTPVLYLEIRVWAPDAPVHTRFVIVGMAASVLDPTTRTVRWSKERRAAPVPTPGVVIRESAYVIAARKVIEEMLSPLAPDPPAR